MYKILKNIIEMDDYSVQKLSNLQPPEPFEWNTVEGTELNISDCIGGKGKIEVKGNTYQKQLSGKNLLYVYGNQWYSSATQKFTNNADFVSLLGKVKPNTTYTISKKNASNRFVVITSEVEIQAGVGYVRKLLEEQNKTRLQYTFTTNENENYVMFGVYAGTNEDDILSAIENAQIEEGSTATDYEPYCGGQPSPNPDYPQPIKVVIGDNVVKHVGKNLLNKDGTFTNKYIDDNGVSHPENVGATFDEYISCYPNTDYIYHANTSVRNLAIIFYDKNKNFIQRNIARNANYLQVTAPNNAKYILLSTSYNATDTVTQEVINNLDLQLEQGSTATPYEPYREEECKLDLWKENEFDKDNANIYGGYLDTNGIVNGSGSGAYDTIVYIECKPNTTYLLKKTQQIDTENNRFRIGCTSEIPARNMQTTNFFKYADGTSETEYVYTTSSTARYLLFYCGRASKTTSREQLLNSIQIQEAIELCKIGDYSDILFKNEVGDENYNAELEEGAWYKYKKISKQLVDRNTMQLKDTYNNIAYVTIPKESNFIGYNAFTNVKVLCTHGIFKYGGDWDLAANDGYIFTVAQKNVFWIGIKKGTTLEEAKAKMNGMYIYYPISTPLYEKITDSTLILQLEALRKAKWFKGINHWWTETNNLEPVLKGTYRQAINE